MLSNAPWQLALKQGPHEQKGSLAAFAVGLDAGNVIGAYSTGDKSSTSVCIVIPDILGWRSPQNLRLCDELADATGWLVVCPDLHRGNVVDKWVADQVSVLSIHTVNECAQRMPWAVMLDTVWVHPVDLWSQQRHFSFQVEEKLHPVSLHAGTSRYRSLAA